MSPADLGHLVERLSPDLAKLSEPWTIIGSGALMILGLPLDDCPDLDILTTTAGAAWLEGQWSGWRQPHYLPDPASAFRSRFSRYSAPQGPVEVMGDLRLRTRRGWAPVVVQDIEARTFAGLRVQVPTAAEQLRILRQFGRPKDLAKARALEAWLAAT